MLAIVLILSLAMLVIDFKEFGGEHAKTLFAGFETGKLEKVILSGGCSSFSFWLVALISTFQSEYFYESFLGK